MLGFHPPEIPRQSTLIFVPSLSVMDLILLFPDVVTTVFPLKEGIPYSCSEVSSLGSMTATTLQPFSLNNRAVFQPSLLFVNTAIFSQSGGSVGIGFAISSNLANSVVKQLVEFGRTRRGWLGVYIQDVTEEIAASLDFNETRGALVSSVRPCLLYTSPSPRDQRGSRMPSSA